MSVHWSRRGRVAALLVLAGYSAELAALANRTPHQALRIAFLFGVCWNVVAAVAWGSRALRGGPEARGFWLGTASFVALTFAHSAAALAGRPGLAGFMFPLGEALSTALLVAGVLSWPWRRLQAGRGLAGMGATVFTASIVLLLWLLGSWAATRSPDPLLSGVQLGLTLRGALSSGVVIYLLLEAPDRWRGMLGWALGAAVAGGVVLGFFQRLLSTGHMPDAAGAAHALVPLFLAGGAWTGAPAETSPAGVAVDRRWLLLVFVPFLLLGGILAAAQLRHAGGITWPNLAFIALAVGVVAMAGLSIHELATTQRDLEARVVERTRRLQDAMVALVRNQRLNVLALIGAGATHDLKNLLAVIRNHATVLREELASGPADVRQSLGDLDQAAERAAALVTRILAYVNDDIEPPALLDLAGIIRSEQPVLRAVVPRLIELRLDVPQTPALIQCATHRIEQIVLNLLANACAALGTSGHIVVRIAPGTNGRWLLQVEDDGPGVAPEVAERLFEPLITTRAGRGGTGLGLASVKALAELDGGTVAIRSARGRGTTVEVQYPGAGATPPLHG